MRRLISFAGNATYIVIVLLARLLRPLVLIRFGGLRSDRIGHFAVDTDFYLCERAAGLQSRRAIDFFYTNGAICNQHLAIMTGRLIRLYRRARLLDLWNRSLPGSAPHTITVISRDIHGSRDVSDMQARTPPFFVFTAEEERTGQALLREMGIPDGQPFICFHARDNAYLEPWVHQWNSSYDARYHDFRNSNIGHYLSAMEEMTRRGCYAVRTGASVQAPLASDNPMTIDYATRFRSEFMDIYLGAKCRFFVCDTAGIYAVPRIFRRPIAWVNFIPLEYVHAWMPQDISIFKKLRMRGSARDLSCREIVEMGAGRLLNTQDYDSMGFDVIENSSQEIQDLVVEMDERLSGRWQADPADEDLQRDFWSLLKTDELNSVFRSRIGARFLRQDAENQLCVREMHV